MSPPQVAVKPTIGVYHHPPYDAWQLVLRGQHDTAVDALQFVLAGLGAESRIVADLSRATFVGPGVVTTLSGAAKRARRKGGRVVLVASGAGPTAPDLPSSIARYDALEPALAAVAAPAPPDRAPQRSPWIALVSTLLGH